MALLTSGIGLCMVGWLRRPRGMRNYCPGPSPGVAGRLHPRRWVWRCGCWYDLTGLPETPDGARRCPECGTEIPEKRDHSSA